MKRDALMAMVMALAVAGVCSSQTAEPAAPATQEPASKQRPAEPARSRPEDKQSLSESAQKVKKEIEDTLEKTGDVVREALGNMKEGCLKQGNEADPYLLEQSETGATITVVGSPDLVRHIGHTVRLQGREESDGRVFHATTVEQIAASCAALPEQQPNENKHPGQLTAGDQGSSAADRKLTQAIRKALVDDETLSTLGQNVKIISQSGLVTLKGPVRSEDEKRSIEAKAAAVAGAGRVSNELTVEAGDAATGASGGKK